MAEVAGPLLWVMYVCLAMLSISIVLSFIRLVKGPSLPDRVVALDLIAYQAIALMIVYAITMGQSNFLEAALVLALIAFLGTVAFARFIEYISAPEMNTAEEL